LRIFKSEVKAEDKAAPPEALEASADPVAEKKPEQQV
jgi:hypothetical protein